MFNWALEGAKRDRGSESVFGETEEKRDKQLKDHE